MTARAITNALGPVCAVVAAAVLAGCSNPDATTTPTRTTTTTTATRSSPQNPGEPIAPAAPSASAQQPADVKRTAQGALRAFAALYVNWTYRSLSANQRGLAAMAVGAARLSERQAAAASHADSTIARARIWNKGRVISIAQDRQRPGMWVIVTREQTGGDSEYDGLPAAYHVTLARLAPVSTGFAVTEWLPQS